MNYLINLRYASIRLGIKYTENIQYTSSICSRTGNRGCEDSVQVNITQSNMSNEYY